MPFAQSYFSEEDLPSNIIGFYVATNMHKWNLDTDTLIRDIDRLCGLLSKEESIAVFRKEYQSGSGFVQGWKNWHARLVPLANGSCISCDYPRKWPSQFSEFVNTAIHSNRNASWWWYANPWVDGHKRKTNVDGVFALDKPNPPPSGP